MKTKMLSMVSVCGLTLLLAGTTFADTSETDLAGTLGDTGVVIPTNPSSATNDSSTPTSSEATDEAGATIDNGETIPSSADTLSSSTDVASETETSSSSETTTETGTLTETSEGIETSSTDTATETDDTISKPDENGNVTIPTIDGETAIVNTDKSQATNNPNVSAQTAYNSGASQVGTTSQVTGQIVRDVTTANPVTLSSGVTITDIQSGVATLSDGSTAKLTDLGGTENADKTFSVTTIDGETVTLPETGEVTTASVAVGLLVILASLGLGFKDKLKTLVDKTKAKSRK